MGKECKILLVEFFKLIGRVSTETGYRQLIPRHANRKFQAVDMPLWMLSTVITREYGVSQAVDRTLWLSTVLGF